MRRSTGVTTLLVGLVLVIGAVVLSADTLVMRDGRRIRGELVSVQRGVVQFRQAGGFGARMVEVQLDDVQRIEIDEVPGYDYRDRTPRGEGRGLRDQVPGREGRAGLRERDVWVTANRPWTDSGIDVRPNQIVYFDTHGGDIQWRPGEHTRANGVDAESRAPRPMPNRGLGALIGKVGGGSTDYFFIGENDGPIRVRDGGRLMLGINDQNLQDNSGAFRVTVFY